ncbi:MAG TPA: adenine phosphoribosyltransferase [Polyangiales bacterium]|jgi:adenine phosphoribosyltransferase
MGTNLDLIKQRIRDVPNFPKPGITFKDITPMLADPKAFNLCLDAMAEHYDGVHFDAIVGMESRGFIFGAALASRLRKAFVPARKPGKLPAATYRVNYDLEYGTDAIEIHRDALKAGEKVLIVDDLLATGGTAWATAQLVQKLGAELIGACFVIELTFLPGRERLRPVEAFSLIQY